MEVKTRITWLLLLALGCLVHSVRPEDLVDVSPITKGTEDKVSIPVATVTPGTKATTPKPSTASATLTTGTALVEVKETTVAPTAGAPQTTTATPPPTAAKTTTPSTTVKPTTKAPVSTTVKISAPLSGASKTVQSLTTTISKPDNNPTTAGGQKSTAPLAVGVPVSGATTLQTAGSTIMQPLHQTMPPNIKTTISVKVTENPGNAGTTRVPGAPPTAPTHVKETVQDLTVGTTTTQDSNKATGTTAVVTKNPSPGQGLGPSRSTAPSKPSQTSSKAPTVTTEEQRAGPDVVSQSTVGTAVRPQTTIPQTMVPQTTTEVAPSTIAPVPSIFTYSLNKEQQSEEEKDMVTLCQQVMRNLEEGNCTLRHHNGKVNFDSVEISGKVKSSVVRQHYEDITKKPTDNRTLITILASCGALLIMIIILAVCASHYRKPYNENQQHLTEELQTVENGYHDNPTLEVMEVQPEMQEKKLALNGEFNDSWIVPIDNLLKEDVPDEEDTHL